MTVFFKKSIAATVALAAVLAFQSCEKEAAKAPFRLEIVSGDGQKGPQGELLAGGIRVRALKPDGTPADGYPIRVTARSGSIALENPPFWSNEIAPLNKSGQQNIAWTLGCDPEARLEVTLFSPKCDQTSLLTGLCDSLATVSVRATSILQKGWVRACGLSNLKDFSRDDLKFRDGPNGEIYMIVFGQIFRTTNEGLEWQAVPSPVPFGSGTADLGVAANGDLWALQLFEGIFFTRDGGQSWINGAPNGGVPFSNASRLLIDGDRIFANFDFSQGLYRTSDGGQTWKNITIAGSFYNDFENVARASTGNLYVIDDYPKVFKSANDGDSWTALSVSSANIGSGLVGGLAATEDGKLTFFSQSGNAFYELNLATNAVVKKVFSGPVRFPYRRNGQNMLLAYDPVDGSGTIYLGTGATFNTVDTGFDKGPIEAFYVAPSGKLLLATRSGVYVYVD